MNGSGKAGNGRGNNKKRYFGRQNNEKNENPKNKPRHKQNRRRGNNPGIEKPVEAERLKWTAPKLNTDPLPVPDCSWCGKPIRDISQAISDKNTGSPVHFDCVTARLSENEKLEKGDTLSYIGGGRFGIVNFGNSSSQEGGSFTIKKIIEWEKNDSKALWREEISEHYSVT